MYSSLHHSQYQKIEELHKINSSNELFEKLGNLIRADFGLTGFQIFFKNDQTGTYDFYYSSFEDSDAKDIGDFLQSSSIAEITNNKSILLGHSEQNGHLRGACSLDFQDTPFGCLSIHGESEVFLEGWQEYFLHIAEAVGTEIIKMQLFESATSEAQLSLAKLQGIHVSLELIKDLDLDTILMKLMGLSLKTMNAAVGSIMILEKDVLKTKTDMGFSDDIAHSLVSVSGKKYLDFVLQSDDATVILDAKNSDILDLTELPVNLTSIITVPLRTQKDNLGLLHIINSEDNFDQTNFEVLQTICNLSSYALENAILYQSQMESTRLKEAMDIAQQIHLSLLPKSELKIGNIEICGWSKTCDETGGDYYDLIEASDDRVEIIVGDATGHGIGAAQTMLITRSSLRTLFQLNMPLKKVFEHLNNRIAQDTSDEKFMTLFCGSLNPLTNVLSYCSGGHDGPIVIREGQTEVAELEATGVPLGMMEDMEYEVVEGIQLQKGDLVIMGSDGTWEAMNTNNEEYGKARLIEIARANAKKEAKEINELIQKDIMLFIGQASIRDDMTLIVLKINP